MKHENAAGYPKIEQSERYFQRALGLIPALTQTLAKGPTQYVRGVAPMYLERGRGARVWDVDGNEYVDLTMALGPLSLGYGHPRVDQAIMTQLERGITFSLPHVLEVEVAEQIRDLVPGAEMVRFSKTGADVTSAAVRLARAFTGRDSILCCGYHGWHDWTIGISVRPLGVPGPVRALTRRFTYNDFDGFERQLDSRVAAVILEPVVYEDPLPEFLPALARACRDNGSLLVFDEMWTGFRVALGGAQQRYGVRADLCCFSKAVANGMPLSVLTGRRDVMQLLDNDVFFFTTFGGEALSLAAAKATLRELVDADVPHLLELKGARLKQGYNTIARELGASFTRCVGLECRGQIVFDPDAADPLLAKSLVQQELLRHGVLWSGHHNMSLAHGDAEIDQVLKGYRDALGTLVSAVQQGNVAQRLRGEPVQPVFRNLTART